MRIKALTLLGAVALLSIGTAQAAPVLWNTGVDDSGTPLGLADPDPHYTRAYHVNDEIAARDAAIAGGLTAYAVTEEGKWPIPPWLPDNDQSAWISPQKHTTAANETDAPGIYAFTTEFWLTAHEATYFHLAGRWSTDNPGLDIYANKTSTGHTIDFQTTAGYSFQNWHAFDIGPGNWAEGRNTLTFIVQNTGGSSGNPTAVRVEMAPVPIPAALPLGLFGMGLVGLVTKRRSKAKTA